MRISDVVRLQPVVRLWRLSQARRQIRTDDSQLVGRLLSLALDGHTASSSTQVRTESQLTRAQGRQLENRAEVNRKEMWLNVVVVLASGWVPAGGCRSDWAWCSWGSFLPAVVLGRFFCLLFVPFSFRATSERTIISGLRQRASHSCSRTGGTSGRKQWAPTQEPELSATPYAVLS